MLCNVYDLEFVDESFELYCFKFESYLVNSHDNPFGMVYYVIAKIKTKDVNRITIAEFFWERDLCEREF